MHDVQKDIYPISNCSIIFAAIKLYKHKFFTLCFDCAAARKQFESICEYNISEICIRVTRPLDSRCLNNVIHLVDRKTMAASLRQNVSDFCLNTGKLFFLEILF